MGRLQHGIVSVFVFILGLGLMTMPRDSGAYQPLPSELKGWGLYQSTVLSGFVQPTENRFIKMNLASPSGRALPIRLWKSMGLSRGLYILLPGTGADSTSGLANVLAETTSRNGYDTLILANPFSAAFQKTFSSDGLVGFPQKDFSDLEEMLYRAQWTYNRYYGQPATLNLIGFSLGGFYTVLMANKGKRVYFDRFIAMNPTVNFQYGMDQIDNNLRVRMSDTATLERLVGNAVKAFVSTVRGFTTLDISRLRTALPGDDLDNRQLIGFSFGSTLGEITKNLADTREFSTQADRVRLSRLSPSVTFQKYMGVVGMALGRKGYFQGKTFAQLAAENDLRRLLKTSHRKIDTYIIHNQDDLLVKDSELRDLGSILGPRLVVFEAGGHCGNYWTPSLKKELRLFISR